MQAWTSPWPGPWFRHFLRPELISSSMFHQRLLITDSSESAAVAISTWVVKHFYIYSRKIQRIPMNWVSNIMLYIIWTSSQLWETLSSSNKSRQKPMGLNHAAVNILPFWTKLLLLIVLVSQSIEHCLLGWVKFDLTEYYFVSCPKELNGSSAFPTCKSWYEISTNVSLENSRNHWFVQL